MHDGIGSEDQPFSDGSSLYQYGDQPYQWNGAGVLAESAATALAIPASVQTKIEHLLSKYKGALQK